MTYDPGWSGVAEFLVTFAGFVLIALGFVFAAVLLVGLLRRDA